MDSILSTLLSWEGATRTRTADGRYVITLEPQSGRMSLEFEREGQKELSDVSTSNPDQSPEPGRRENESPSVC